MKTESGDHREWERKSHSTRRCYESQQHHLPSISCGGSNIRAIWSWSFWPAKLFMLPQGTGEETRESVWASQRQSSGALEGSALPPKVSLRAHDQGTSRSPHPAQEEQGGWKSRASLQGCPGLSWTLLFIPNIMSAKPIARAGKDINVTLEPQPQWSYTRGLACRAELYPQLQLTQKTEASSERTTVSPRMRSLWPSVWQGRENWKRSPGHSGLWIRRQNTQGEACYRHCHKRMDSLPIAGGSPFSRASNSAKSTISWIAWPLSHEGL